MKNLEKIALWKLIHELISNQIWILLCSTSWYIYELLIKKNGRLGIRTLVPLKREHVFETCALNLSANLPFYSEDI